MGRSVSHALTAAIVALLSTSALAQEPTPSPSPTPNVSALRRLISRLPAAMIDADAVRDAVAGAEAAATPGPAATPEPAVSPSPQAGDRAPWIGEVRVQPRTMRLGELLYVPLEPKVEAEAKSAIAAQVRSQTRGSWVTFPGAFQTLSTDKAELTLVAVAFGGPPLRFNRDREQFEGTINVGVLDIGGRASQLSEEILFQVLGATATPETLSVKSTAPPFPPIAIASDSTDRAVDVQVFSRLSNEAVKLTLPLQPALVVDVSPRHIEGWGLEKAEVQVSARGLAAGGARRALLKWDHGVVEPGKLALDADGTATAAIHSRSTGEATVTARGAGFTQGSDKVTFDFPWKSLLAVLLGGLVGGLLRAGAPRRGAWASFLGKLGLGVLVGAVVFVLFALGINVTGFPIPARAGELVVFAVVALGAFGGTRLLTPAKPA